METWKLALFFVLCLLISLVLNLPVKQVLPYAKLPPTVQLAGIDGTVFGGRVGQVDINQFILDDVDYDFEWTCLFLLEACYDLEYPQGELELAYALTSGDAEITDARLEYPAAVLAAQVRNLPLKPDGQIELTLEQLYIVAGKPAGAIGSLVWRNLGVNQDEVQFNIGDYQLDFSGNRQAYDFKINDLDADLDVQGDGKLSANGQYEIDVKIESAGEINARVKSMLDVFAAKDGYNKYRISQTGRLPPNLVRQLF